MVRRGNRHVWKGGIDRRQKKWPTYLHYYERKKTIQLINGCDLDWEKNRSREMSMTMRVRRCVKEKKKNLNEIREELEVFIVYQRALDHSFWTGARQWIFYWSRAIRVIQQNISWEGRSEMFSSRGGGSHESRGWLFIICRLRIMTSKPRSLWGALDGSHQGSWRRHGEQWTNPDIGTRRPRWKGVSVLLECTLLAQFQLLSSSS